MQPTGRSGAEFLVGVGDLSLKTRRKREQVLALGRSEPGTQVDATLPDVLI
jgi:hypothetical protein